jgi:hypothetical protein
MNKILGITLVLVLTIFSCQRKVVCPAYQSAFYLDKEKTEDFFSLFGEDSIPKSDVTVNKNKYGIIVKVKYKKKKESMNTVKMKTIFPPPKDSLLLAENNVAEMDSASIDTLFDQSYKNKFKYNRDQKLYMLAMDPYFEYKDPGDITATDEPAAAEEPVEEKKKKRSWWPFGKKNKDQDNLTEETKEEEVVEVEQEEKEEKETNQPNNNNQ